MTASVIETIKTRKSIRTFSDRKIDVEKRQQLTASLQSGTAGFFGNTVRFQLVDFSASKTGEKVRLGTYGFVSGASTFIVGWIKPAPGAGMDFGYAMERHILEATKMGLGTCWLGGTFQRKRLMEHLGLPPDVVIPAITPVGIPADRRTLREAVIRRGAGSDHRKPPEALFFCADSHVPLPMNEAGAYREVLECVRLAPSASNKQPWRVVFDPEQTAFHLYLERTKGADHSGSPVRMQDLDMGIAMCHFELAAESLGLKGGWKIVPSDAPKAAWEYIVTWAGMHDPEAHRQAKLSR